ncbi:MAG: glutamine--fructose-6-phosphate transaminase (isomerizing) [Burkholderiales bacterium]|nr:glutamine--fructose-6-phosphate transaminase (isomerizing) [Burkholderiales bacterium]
MCGIVGAVSQRNIVPILVEGLKRLEYRGYDSCGVAVHQDGGLRRARSTSRVAELQHQADQDDISAGTGIAHTRWATHGAPAVHNAHPHFSTGPGASSDSVGQSVGRVALVHNGIIENHDELRAELKARGYVFSSQTDTEVIAHLIDHHYSGDLLDAVQQALPRLKGAYAVAVFCRDEPHRVVAAREGSPLVLGVGENENFVASDAMALAGVTAIANTLDAVTGISPELFGDGAYRIFKDIDNVLILACGTSYYSGSTAKYWLESIAKIPTSVEIASEYRYRDSVPNPRTLVVTISQSGETADTIAALKHARAQGMPHTLTICNVSTSAMVRECELAYITRAGAEIGVASTKAFTTQLVGLFLLTLALAQTRGHLSEADEAEHLKALRHLPVAVQAVLALEPQVIAWSEEFARKENALFLGRGLHYPIALEGALKLKEISYIHAEAYPAGELKHGPLALVTAEMPVVTVAPNDALLEKLKSNMQEVRARGGQLYVFADGDTAIESEAGLHVIRMPEHYGALSPILHVVPLQLLAYHTACARGTDVDKPRNLAKSVTVE